MESKFVAIMSEITSSDEDGTEQKELKLRSILFWSAIVYLGFAIISHDFISKFLTNTYFLGVHIVLTCFFMSCFIYYVFTEKTKTIIGKIFNYLSGLVMSYFLVKILYYVLYSLIIINISLILKLIVVIRMVLL